LIGQHVSLSAGNSQFFVTTRAHQAFADFKRRQMIILIEPITPSRLERSLCFYANRRRDKRRRGVTQMFSCGTEQVLTHVIEFLIQKLRPLFKG